MLAHYFTLLPSARPVAFFIKQWSKKRGLNDPSGSGGFVTLSSYSLVLLFVSYLQKKGLLPHLQAPQEDASPRKLLRGTLAQAFKNEDRPVDWDVSWSRLDPGLWRPDSPSAHELAAVRATGHTLACFRLMNRNCRASSSTMGASLTPRRTSLRSTFLRTGGRCRFSRQQRPQVERPIAIVATRASPRHNSRLQAKLRGLHPGPATP